MDEMNTTGQPAPENITVPEPAPAAEGVPAPAQAEDLRFGFKDEAVAPQAQAASADVPEKYTFNLPEGLQMTEELEGRFTTIAKEAGLTQAQADSLIKMHADIVTGIQEQAMQIKNEWATQCKQEGLTEPANLRAAKLAVETFGGAEAMSALVDSGVCFNPAVQRMLQQIGKLMQEDNTPDGASTTKEQNAADLLFGNSKY